MTETFDEFQHRKTDEAREASIEPFVTERDQAEDRFAVIGNAWSRAMFGGFFYVSPSAPPDWPAANLVFVQSRDGNTVTGDPYTLGGGDADTHLVYEGLSRVTADAVLAGSKTVGAGNLVMSVWHPELVALRRAMAIPRHPMQIIATRQTLALDHGLMFNTPDVRVCVITTPRSAAAMDTMLKARPWITPVVVDEPIDMARAFVELRRLGVERLSCIGGRTLAASLLDAGLIQDVYLTTGTKTGGEANTPFYAKPLHGREVVRKRGTGADTGVIFEHISISSPA